MAKKPDSFTVQPPDGEAFTVRVGDKVVLVSSRRSMFSRNEACPSPDYRRVETVIAMRGGKFPRIEFDINSADAQGKTGFGGYRVEPYDEANEVRHAAVEANHTAMTQAVSQIRRMTDDEWQRLCIDPVRREALLKLVASPPSQKVPAPAATAVDAAERGNGA